MKKIFETLLLSITIFVISACNRKFDSSSNYYMTLDSIDYVTEFPHTYILEDFRDVNTEVIGYYNFCIIDSFLIFSTTDGDGFWSFVSLSNKNILGQFLKRGQGPDEFLFSPDVETATNFFKYNGKHFAAIYDSQKGKVYKMDIDETLRSRELSISIMKDSIPPFLFNFVMLDTTKFLCKAVNNEATQQLRYFRKNNIKGSSPNLEKLNSATIKAGSDINIVSTMTKYSQKYNIIVEMPVMLNYLNFYSPDENFGKTICIGNKLNNIEIIQNTNFPEVMETFFDLRLYNDFFGVLFVNEDKFSKETGRKKTPSIFLFNWQGNPIAELKLNRHLTSFDIDFNKGLLYGLDYVKEDFFQYDINGILKVLINK
jgi:hypothetical protein